MPIAVVSVPVADQDRALAFYTDVMGFRLVRDEPMGPGPRWIQLQPPGGGATITLVTWFDKAPPGSCQGLLLDVEDIAAEHDRLAGKGLDVPPIAAEDWGRYTLVQDSDGNGWVVAELSAASRGA